MFPTDDLRSVVRWLNGRNTLSGMVRALREVLPGDSEFGDPLSTAGTDPAQVLARRAWAASGGRWTVLAELGLAGLQLADWLGPQPDGVGPDSEVAVLFTDLVGYSSWAVHAGDGSALRLLREVDAVVSQAVQDAGGSVVKRLGDGTMAVFPEAPAALAGAQESMRATAECKADGYDPELRAGLHFGSPQPIGGDFIGVDVNIAARLCEAAGPSEILMTEKVADHLDGAREDLRRYDAHQLPGVPRALQIYAT